MKNGALLKSAEEEFDVFLTLDRSLQYQQNLSTFDLAVILIRADSSRRRDVKPAMKEVNQLLSSISPGRLYVVRV